MNATRRERARFRDLLARFKREGCNLLVVGESDPATRRAASRRLFGVPDHERDRVLIAVGDVTADEWLPAAGTVVSVSPQTRNGAVADSQSAPPSALDDRVALEDAAPGQLRLGVTSIEPYLDERETLGALRNRVLRANGMGHYHLGAPYGAEVTERLADDFEAVLELRRTEAGPQERWHVADADLTTAWVPIDG